MVWGLEKQHAVASKEKEEKDIFQIWNNILIESWIMKLGVELDGLRSLRLDPHICCRRGIGFLKYFHFSQEQLE